MIHGQSLGGERTLSHGRRFRHQGVKKTYTRTAGLSGTSGIIDWGKIAYLGDLVKNRPLVCRSIHRHSFRGGAVQTSVLAVNTLNTHATMFSSAGDSLHLPALLGQWGTSAVCSG